MRMRRGLQWAPLRDERPVPASEPVYHCDERNVLQLNSLSMD